MMYKQHFSDTAQIVNAICRCSDNAFIPFDPDNTDYAEFKKAVTAGVELQDASGNVMSPEAAQAFVATLP
jgi:hypothetical protein